MPTRRIALCVNARDLVVDVPSTASLLQVLRNDVGLNGPKYGCGLGECGACLVLIDGTPARSCVVPVGGIEGRAVTTLEGLGTIERPHPVQQAFIDAQAAQCGYCLNGMIVATVALLASIADPSDDEIDAALSHNLCRCGAHVEIRDAVRRAVALTAALMAASEATAMAASYTDDAPSTTDAPFASVEGRGA